MICMEKFVFDTNILIDLKHFNPLVFKSLWENIQFMLEINMIYSVLEVHNELSKTEDMLNEKWEEFDRKFGFFIDLSEKANSMEYWEVMRELEIFETFQKHGEREHYWADPYLISVAKVDGSIVVTNETMNRNPKRKIPFVCQELGIPCMTFDEFMIHNGWQW